MHFWDEAKARPIGLDVSDTVLAVPSAHDNRGVLWSLPNFSVQKTSGVKELKLSEGASLTATELGMTFSESRGSPCLPSKRSGGIELPRIEKGLYLSPSSRGCAS